MDIKSYIRRQPIWIQSRNRLQGIKLKSGASVYLVIKTFLKHIFDPNLNIMASGIAYNFLMSLFPGIIFLFTLIPFLLPYFEHPLDAIEPDLQQISLIDQLSDMMKEVLPTSLYDFTFPIIEDVAGNKRGGLMSVGFFFAFYLSTNAMIAIMDSFNHYYQTRESRNWFQKRAVALGLMLMFALAMLLSVIVFIFGHTILESLENFKFIENYVVQLVELFRYLVIGLMFYLIISCIYFFAPAIKKRFSFFSIGSFIATVLIISVSQAFSYYVNNFGNYNKLYGTIGGLVGLMVLFYAMAYIILLGFQINASIYGALEETIQEKKLKSKIS